MPDIEFERYRRARDRVAAMVLLHPEVSLVDIGFDLQETDLQPAIVIRVHVRRSFTHAELGLPETIDSIRVVLIPGRYQLE